MRRAKLLLAMSLLLPAVTQAPAAVVRSWTVSSAAEFAKGTFEGTALDSEGRVVLSRAIETLWGPDDGIVWDVEPDGSGGVFVALSSPTRVLRVTPGGEPELWYSSGDEALVAAILPDGKGGLYIGLSPDGRLFHASAAGEAHEIADSEALFIWALEAAADGSVWIGTGLPGSLLRLDAEGRVHRVFESPEDPVRCIVAMDEGGAAVGDGARGHGQEEPQLVVGGDLPEGRELDFAEDVVLDEDEEKDEEKVSGTKSGFGS